MRDFDEQFSGMEVCGRDRVSRRQWFVRVIENGVVSIRMFELNNEALTYARLEGQRLGVPSLSFSLRRSVPSDRRSGIACGFRPSDSGWSVRLGSFRR